MSNYYFPGQINGLINVDKVFDPTSENPQSGLAVEEAVSSALQEAKEYTDVAAEETKEKVNADATVAMLAAENATAAQLEAQAAQESAKSFASSAEIDAQTVNVNAEQTALLAEQARTNAGYAADCARQAQNAAGNAIDAATRAETSAAELADIVTNYTKTLGDIETALDAIIAMQETLIGGDA